MSDNTNNSQFNFFGEGFSVENFISMLQNDPKFRSEAKQAFRKLEADFAEKRDYHRKEAKLEELRLNANRSDLSIEKIQSDIDRDERELRIKKKEMEEIEKRLEISRAKIPNAAREAIYKSTLEKKKFHEKSADDAITMRGGVNKMLQIIEELEGR